MTMALGITAFMSLLVGITFCFFGYSVYRAFVWVYGFLFGIGFGAGFVLGFDPHAATGVVFAAMILCGLGFAWLCSALHVLPVILMGIGTGIYLALRFVPHTGRPDLFLLMIAAVIGAVVAYALKRFVLIGWTGITGASLIVNGLLLFVPGAATDAMIKQGDFFLSSSLKLNPGLGVLATVVFAGLAIGGIAYQYFNTKDLAYQEKRGF